MEVVENEKNEFDDILDLPGTVEQGFEHNSTNRPYKIICKDLEKVNYCKCCHLPVETPGVLESYPICSNIKDYLAMGIGVRLFFSFIHFCLAIAFVLLCLVLIPELIYCQALTKEIKSFCDKLQKTDPLYTTVYSICYYYIGVDFPIFSINDNWMAAFNFNVIKKYRTIVTLTHTGIEEDIINVIDMQLLTFVISIILIVVGCLFFLQVYTRSIEADLLVESASDYTVFIDNLENAIEYVHDQNEGKVINFEEEYIKYVTKDVLKIDDSSKISEINLCYILNDFYENEKKKIKAKTRLNSIKNASIQIELNNKHGNTQENGKLAYFDGKFCCKKQILKTDIEKELEEISLTIDKQIKEAEDDFYEHSAASMFISFESIKMKDDFLKRHPYSRCHRLIKAINRIFSCLFECCLCCVDENKRKLMKIENEIGIYEAPEPDDVIWENLEYSHFYRRNRTIIAYIACIFGMAVSFGLLAGLNYAQFEASILVGEGDESKEKRMSDTAVSYVISFTISVATKIVAYILWENQDQDNLVKNTMMMFITNDLITPFFWLANVAYLKLCYKAWLVGYHEEKNPKALTQREINEYFDNPEMDICGKYSYVAHTLLMTAFYATLFPLGIFITIVGLTFAYFVEKGNLHCLYKRPEMLNEDLALFYFDLFKYIIIAFVVGNFIFIQRVTDELSAWEIVNIVLIIILVFFPIGKLLSINLIPIDESEINTNNYFKVKSNLTYDYERLNPLTKKKVIKKYLSKLRMSSYISEENYQIQLKNLNKLNPIEVYIKANLAERSEKFLKTHKNKETKYGGITGFVNEGIVKIDKNKKNENSTTNNQLLTVGQNDSANTGELDILKIVEQVLGSKTDDSKEYDTNRKLIQKKKPKENQVSKKTVKKKDNRNLIPNDMVRNDKLSSVDLLNPTKITPASKSTIDNEKNPLIRTGETSETPNKIIQHNKLSSVDLLNPTKATPASKTTIDNEKNTLISKCTDEKPETSNKMILNNNNSFDQKKDNQNTESLKPIILNPHANEIKQEKNNEETQGNDSKHDN